ncbi:hypothetical protein PGRAT_22365 [Paenibacillus graminis]|uniref:Uncharacterized protein n=1 Tax=Paenibacillus graminis TaxID=189425 RepID=A0A089MA04_9BACL|nr:hypothetical protein PGRAT_22365 [Paenibacillus graminis]
MRKKQGAGMRSLSRLRSALYFCWTRAIDHPGCMGKKIACRSNDGILMQKVFEDAELKIVKWNEYT